MNKLLLAAALLLSTDAHAYSSAAGSDPQRGTAEKMTRQVIKSTTAGYSDAVSRGHILSFSTQTGA